MSMPASAGADEFLSIRSKTLMSQYEPHLIALRRQFKGDFRAILGSVATPGESQDSRRFAASYDPRTLYPGIVVHLVFLGRGFVWSDFNVTEM